MIEINDKVNCSGCTACYAVCPQSAIEMKLDEEGFKYPRVDKMQLQNMLFHAVESYLVASFRMIEFADIQWRQI